MAALCLPSDHVFCDCRLSAIVQARIVRGLSTCLGVDKAADAHFASSWAANGRAAGVAARFAQQLWADGGHWRLDAESCADNLCVRRIGSAPEGRSERRVEAARARLVVDRRGAAKAYLSA